MSVVGVERRVVIASATSEEETAGNSSTCSQTSVSGFKHRKS